MIFLRLLRIFFILARHRLDRNLPDQAKTLATLPLRLLLKLIPPPARDGAESARLALEELGPIFIKFGQILSTRRDLFEEPMSRELQKLQDQVPPFDSDTARAIIEQNLGSPLEQYFADFDPKPLASASLAQVHTATIEADGGTRQVVIKVIRPGVETAIKRDIQVMYFAARLLERLWSDASRLHPVEIVRDYETTILGELDLRQEAANTKKLRQNWQLSGKLYVPRIYDAYSSDNVMVMERIYGVTATDIETLTREKVNLKKLAHLGVEIFFAQVFEQNFFHADMHPGNVFVDIRDPDNPTYIALDCAIIGSLTENDKNYLARNLMAFFNRDYNEVARLHLRSGWVPPGTDEDEFASVIRKVCDPYFQKPIKEISFGKVLLELFQTARQFDMEIQPQLVLLQKTLINIEGMGRQIYPDLDLWETAAPIMEKWMKDRLGIGALIRRIVDSAPRWLEQLPELPDLVYNTMIDVNEMAETSRSQVRMLGDVQLALETQNRKSRSQRLGGLALIGAILSMLLPATGYLTAVDPVIPGSVLGTLGIYWMYIHS
ncbi:MAG: ubiquinone biosynthesis regulatory protein kinase UbiB [Gammaproteobacteria bacterium]|jgi:ubiquinone biosynthesis protein|nr:ubiquinone biosynthesis regulatory protein kinase UbiB [Gammaproteobacteria bacterium]MBT4493456.1 ubiquinone biosynthesis regulatory protein kinase UbiB [Gammaproteobacteria bacterium]